MPDSDHHAHRPDPDDHLRRAVDDVLDPVWPDERRRAARRLTASTAGRAAVGVVGFCSLSLVEHVVIGGPVPWAFFGFVGVITTLAAFRNAGDRGHLRRG